MSNEHKSKAELEAELRDRELCEREREISTRLYALKWVERAMWAAMALIASGLLAALLRLVIKQ